MRRRANGGSRRQLHSDGDAVFDQEVHLDATLQPMVTWGTSPEHAVWGLKQRGIRALIGSSFAGICYGNCQRSEDIKAFERRHLQANPWLN